MTERKNTIVSMIKQLYVDTERLTKKEIEEGLSNKFGITFLDQKMNRLLWRFVNQTHQLVKFEENNISYYRLTNRVIKDPIKKNRIQLPPVKASY